MNHTTIIAEAGVNHNGRLDLAFRLVDAALAAGADVVKFQTAVPDLVMTDQARKAVYQRRATGASGSQLEMARKLHLPLSSFPALSRYCTEQGIQFMSSPFDHKSIGVLKALELPTVKVPSGEITNRPYLESIGAYKWNIILSTGMANLGEVEAALSVLFACGKKPEQITLLHCTTDYPTDAENVNLLAMQTLADAFGVKVGYSDHTLGIEIPIAAVALGASVLEKHLTLDRKLPGPDHQASLEPCAFQEMVAAIRKVEKALGRGIKAPCVAELRNKIVARKSIHTVKPLRRGHLIKETDLIMKRPGDGISPMSLPDVVGRRTGRALKTDHKIKWVDLK
jgi:N,N'-diacetyllegionaminate synthase